MALEEFLALLGEEINDHEEGRSQFSTGVHLGPRLIYGSDD